MITLGSYVLLNPIGKGGMGEVWLGEQEGSGRRVAIKVLNSARAADERYLRAFRREARAIASLDHPDVVDVHDYGVIPESAAVQSQGRLIGGTPYMVMEYVEGGTLNQWRQKLDWGQTRAVVLSLLDALAHAHARRVIHRDLKPGNVLVGQQADQIKLTDFGLAHAMDREGITMTSAAGGMGGTPAYMAPEQFVGEPRDVGPWSDLYALGCLVFSLMTGAPPFGRKPWLDVANGHLHKPVPKLECEISVPRGFEAWVHKLLEKDSGKRFQSAADAAWSLCELDDPTELIPRQGLANGFASAGSNNTLRWGDSYSARKAPPPSDTPTALTAIPIRRGGPPMPKNWRGPERRYRPPLGTGLLEVRSLPMMGRERERESVWQALRSVWEGGAARVVVVRGSAGVGKTRLCSWMCTRVDELGIGVSWRSQHSEIGSEQDGLEPMVARWSRAVGLTGDAIRRRIHDQLDLIGQSDAELEAALTELVATHLGASGAVRQTSAGERYETIRRLMARVSADRPIVALLDDVQWGIDSLGFASHVLHSEEYTSALLLLTVRDEALVEGGAVAAALAELEAHEGTVTIELGPLDDRDRHTLLRDVLELSPGLATRVDRRTAGNPEFAVQLVTDWIRKDAVVRRQRGWVLREGVELNLPDDLHEVWKDTIEDLLATRTEEDAIALELAAAMGRQVHNPTWRVACGRSGVIPREDLVEALVSRQLAHPPDESDTWSFQQGTVQESIGRRAREAGRWSGHHEVWAAMYEQAETGVDLAILGRHLVEAGKLREAFRPIRRAAHAAIESTDLPRAEALAGELDGLLDRLGVSDDDAERAWPTLLRGRIVHAKHDTQGARDFGARAVQLARKGKQSKALLEALLLLAWTERSLGRPGRAREHLVEARELAVDIGDPVREARVLASLGAVLGHLGQPSEARALLMKAVRTYEGMGRPELAAYPWLWLGEVARSTGRHDLTQKWAKQAKEGFEVQGNRRGEATALNVAADATRLSGDLDGAERLYRDVLKRYGALGMADSSIARVNLALVLLARERWVDAKAELLRFQAATQHGRPIGQAVAHAGLAACGANEAAWGDVQRHLAHARAAIGRGLVHDVDLANVLQLAGSISAVKGHQRHARAALKLAKDQWVEMGREAQADAVQRALDSLQEQT